MFNVNALAGKFSIFLPLLWCQGMVFWFLMRCFTVFMKFHQTLIAWICQTANALSNIELAFLEETKIMSASAGKGCCNDFQCVFCDYDLCFLCVTLLFTTVMSFLLFFGRSIACSLTSTSNTSISRSFDLSAFLPGRWNCAEAISTSSTFLTVRESADSLMP